MSVLYTNKGEGLTWVKIELSLSSSSKGVFPCITMSVIGSVLFFFHLIQQSDIKLHNCLNKCTGIILDTKCPVLCQCAGHVVMGQYLHSVSWEPF